MPMTTPSPGGASAANSLRTLAEGKAEGITKQTIFRVDPDLVQFEEGFNLRDVNRQEVKDHIDRLYAAMMEGAFIPPIDVVVETGTIICRDGYCRTTAGQRIKEKMPEFTLEARQLRGNEQDALLHMLGTGTGGLPLTPLEAGKGYLLLLKLGLSIPEIAAKQGVSRVTIDKGLKLAEAPVKVQKLIASGKVSSTAAIDALNGGTEGIDALLNAVEKQDAKPAKTKKGKEKKVTAKTLRGTKADKKTRQTKKGKPDADSITVTVSRRAAEVTVTYIDMICDKATEDDLLVHEVKTALETALL